VWWRALVEMAWGNINSWRRRRREDYDGSNGTPIPETPTKVSFGISHGKITIINPYEVRRIIIIITVIVVNSTPSIIIITLG